MSLNFAAKKKTWPLTIPAALAQLSSSTATVFLKIPEEISLTLLSQIFLSNVYFFFLLSLIFPI